MGLQIKMRIIGNRNLIIKSSHSIRFNAIIIDSIYTYTLLAITNDLLIPFFPPYQNDHLHFPSNAL